MTDTNPCPAPEVLFEGVDSGDAGIERHVMSCEACVTLLESHRQLEKDLYRLQDPLPPPDLLVGVMARIAESPVPMRRELWSFATIVGLCSVLLGILFVTGAFGGVTAPASTLVSVFASAPSFAQAVARTIQLIWSAAALPLTAVLGTLLLASLVGLRRLTGPWSSEATA